MIRLPITLHYAEAPQRPTVAWIVPGVDVASWMRIWTSWQLAMCDWRIAILEDVGALTILPAGQTPPPWSPAWPLGRVGSRLYLPIHATLRPATDDREIESMLAENVAVAVALPGQPILTLLHDQVLSVSDLLVAPPVSTDLWNRARAGEVLNDRLYAALPEITPKWEEILLSGDDDIGGKAAHLDELPPAADETPGGWREGGIKALRSAMARLLAAAAQMVANITKALPKKTRSTPTAKRSRPRRRDLATGALGSAIEKVVARAARTMARVAGEIEQRRRREVERLLKMLYKDPDQGLRYAIPLRGDGHRGQSEPSDRLAPSEPEFHLQSLGGGKVADPWCISADQWHKLREAYFALATREMRLGRHRRAAYIFANLLGAYAEAAAALATGGYFREAAALYLDRLGQKHAAAECLERGGLLHEAIALYLELDEQEKVGDLYARLGEPDEAEAAWNRAIRLATLHADYLEAARIALDKLHDDDAALAILRQGWPLSNQAAACLRQTFELFGTCGRHSDAHGYLTELLASAPPRNESVLLAEALGVIVPSYPDRDFGSKAADAVRSLAARHLPLAEQSQQERLCAAVMRLAPGDTQLQRDGRHYPAQVARQRAQSQVRTRRAPPSVQLVRTFHLPREVEWQTAVSQGDQFYAVGLARGKLQLVRCRWTGEWQLAREISSAQRFPELTRFTLAADPHDAGPLLVGSTYPGRETLHQFAPGGEFPHSLRALQRRSDVGTLAVCYAQRQAHVLVEEQELTLVSYAVDGLSRLGPPTRVTPLTVANEDLELPVPIAGRNDALAVGLGRRLFVFGATMSGVRNDERELPASIHALTASASYSLFRLGVGLEQGAAFLAKRWSKSGNDLGAFHFIADELYRPKLCFTLAGRLVAVGENGGEVYWTSRGPLKLERRLSALAAPPIAVMAGPQQSEFAVLLSDGTVHLFDAG